jgi:hypothetical protein
MVTLIIPDLHHKVKWLEEFIAYLKYDEIVLLGDYFDDFGDNPEIAGNTAEWLAWSIRQPKRIHLLGNHDLPYLTPETGDNAELFCSGFSHLKKRAIQNHISFDKLNSFRLVYFTQNWALSHAGIHKYHFEHPVNGVSQKHTEKLCHEALEGVKVGIVSPILRAGRSRGGRLPVGGITWLDWNWDFKPIKGLNQIVGHTKSGSVRYNHMPNKSRPDSINICLDTDCRKLGKVIDGKFEEVSGLKFKRERRKVRHV